MRLHIHRLCDRVVAGVFAKSNGFAALVGSVLCGVGFEQLNVVYRFDFATVEH